MSRPAVGAAEEAGGTAGPSCRSRSKPEALPWPWRPLCRATATCSVRPAPSLLSAVSSTGKQHGFTLPCTPCSLRPASSANSCPAPGQTAGELPQEPEATSVTWLWPLLWPGTGFKHCSYFLIPKTSISPLPLIQHMSRDLRPSGTVRTAGHSQAGHCSS